MAVVRQRAIVLMLRLSHTLLMEVRIGIRRRRAFHKLETHRADSVAVEPTPFQAAPPPQLPAFLPAAAHQALGRCWWCQELATADPGPVRLAVQAFHVQTARRSSQMVAVRRAYR